MDLKLEGKRALVTGSSSGIGEAIALVLAANGASVVVHGRNEERARKVAAGIGEKGAAAVAIGDLARPADAKRVVESAIAAFGGIDILVNNAGGTDGGIKPWLDTAIDQWANTYQQNVLSAVRLVRAFVPLMKERGWGRVIQVGSCVAVQPFPVGADYAASKAALVNTSVSLAKALAGTGITVNTVSPGSIRTPTAERGLRDLALIEGWGDDWAEIERKAVTQLVPNPVGRLGTPEEVAALVAFVASPLAGYINGADLRVDGGLVTSVN
jgi:NAD(P)-dependent dehydrogenase (short-subunit alcohol dehydrogenase family)